MRRLLKDARYAGVALAVLSVVQSAYAVDGVTEINEPRVAAGGVTTGDAPGFPVTLSRPGSYRLTGSLTISDPDVTVIQITSDDVTLDLNGFEIACSTRNGPCDAGSGVGINATNQTNLSVTNGTVRNMGSDGLVAGASARIDSVRALANHHYGIAVGSGSALTNNIANNNGYDGLGGGQATTVTGNTTRSNGRGGIELSTGCTVSGNTANENTVFGIYCNGACTIVHNTLHANKGAGVSLLGGNMIVGNTIHNNTGFGIVAIGTDTGYAQNTLTGNNGGGNAAQVMGGTPLGQNYCGTDAACP